MTQPDAPSGSTTPAPPPEHLIVFSSGSESSAFAAIINLGCMTGAFLGSSVSDRFGRTKALVVSAIPMVLSYLLMSVSRNWVLLTALRFTMGLGVGIGSATAPCYIGEVSTLELRGVMGALNQLSITIGILASNFVGTFVFLDEDFCDWPSMALLGA